MSEVADDTIKEPGVGREGSGYGLGDWLELKYVNLAGLSRGRN